MPVEWVTDQNTFRRGCFPHWWVWFIVVQEAAIYLDNYTLHDMHLQLLYGSQFLQYLHTLYMAQEKILSSWDVSGISGIFNLREGVLSTAQRFGVVVVCFSFPYCGFVLAWEKNIGRTSQTSPRALRKDCFQSYSWLFNPFYSLLLDIHQDAKQGCSHCCAVRAKAIALAFQLLMVRGHQESSLMVDLLPDSLSKLFE